jgi:hypothetical protein
MNNEVIEIRYVPFVVLRLKLKEQDFVFKINIIGSDHNGGFEGK